VYEAAAETLGSVLALFPGADPGSDEVIAELERARERHPHLSVVRNLGDDYLSVVQAANVLIGNSSSGIIEVASLGVPVVDVGDRQKGRLRPRNVLHVGESRAEIVEGIQTAIGDAFRARLQGLVNPYGDGAASERIAQALVEAPLDRLLHKPLVEAEDRGPDLEAMSVRPGATLREALATIDRGGNQIAFVVDDDGRLVGSLTDGDVRRALLAGGDLGNVLDPHVTHLPIVAAPADEPARVLAMMERSGVTQVPIVDDQGRLIGLHLMTAIVSHTLDLDAGLSQEQQA
jgi:CBS domain-containing protein